MSKFDDFIRGVEEQQISNLNRRALIVEGVDDKNAFMAFMNMRKFNDGWESRWVIAEAGSKRNVQEAIAIKKDWMGVVDRDDWTQHEVNSALSKYPNLFVLPRFCIESYLIDPDELWEAIPENHRKTLGNVNTLKNRLNQSLHAWIRHAAMWHTVNPLWRKLRELGFVSGALEVPSVSDDKKTVETIKSWSEVLDEKSTLAEFNRMLSILQNTPSAELFSRWIYAKKFYPAVVLPALNKLLGQKAAKDLRLELFSALPPRDDLEDLWRKMGLVP
jgi:hypothetical protein